MKFTCLQENLARGINTVSKAVPTKGALPILSNIHISTQNGRIRLAATNLETAITTFVGASIEEEGVITVPAKLIKEFVSNLSPSTLSAKLGNDILHINSDKTKSRFNGTSAKDYPELPVFPEDGQSLEIDPKVFSHITSLVSFCAGTDEARPIFTGVYIHFQDGKLTMAATDGFRLSEKTIDVPSETKPFTTIISSKTLAEVAKIFAGSKEPLKIILNENENLALFKSEDTVVATRVLDGQYPDYKRIIPSQHNVTASFASSDFLEAVKLTNIFAKEGNTPVKIRLDPEGIIKISSVSSENGEHESEITAEVEGELTEIAFNTKDLMDFLNTVKAEIVDFSTQSNKTPCLIRAKEHENFLHIIMPRQL